MLLLRQTVGVLPFSHWLKATVDCKQWNQQWLDDNIQPVWYNKKRSIFCFWRDDEGGIRIVEHIPVPDPVVCRLWLITCHQTCGIWFWLSAKTGTGDVRPSKWAWEHLLCLIIRSNFTLQGSKLLKLPEHKSWHPPPLESSHPKHKCQGRRRKSQAQDAALPAHLHKCR